jgi:hypothetical protein
LRDYFSQNKVVTIQYTPLENLFRPSDNLFCIESNGMHAIVIEAGYAKLSKNIIFFNEQHLTSVFLLIQKKEKEYKKTPAGWIEISTRVQMDSTQTTHASRIGTSTQAAQRISTRQLCWSD